MTRLKYIKKINCGHARTGQLLTQRGIIETPSFMPVGTSATIKSLLPEEVEKLGADIILANTFHLISRPGIQIIKNIGGLHNFMGWEKPILTDSGGFQIFSLAPFRKIEEEGIAFRSHINGDLIQLTPESIIKTQQLLGSDIMMTLDECPPKNADKTYIKKALIRDARWAARAKSIWNKQNGALMGIVQGGIYSKLRLLSVTLLTELELDGYALGGFSVGEPKNLMMDIIAETISILPKNRPIYLMGIGDPETIITCIKLGVDMFDCVLPTRMARNGNLLTPYGYLNIRNTRYSNDLMPIDENCLCITCQKYSRAYLRHLFINKELLSYRLNTIHNLNYILTLMTNIRKAITNNEYPIFSRNTLNKLTQNNNKST